MLAIVFYVTVIYIYIYIKWTVFVNVTTKSAQHAHARMIAIIVEKSPNSSHMYDHGFMDNTNRQAVKNWLDSQTRDASLTSWRQPFCKLEWPAISRHLKHWGRDKMAAIFRTTFSDAFSLMKMYEFCLRLHWIFFKGPINNIPALVQIMAWRRPGNTPFPRYIMNPNLYWYCGMLLNHIIIISAICWNASQTCSLRSKWASRVRLGFYCRRCV